MEKNEEIPELNEVINALQQLNVAISNPAATNKKDLRDQISLYINALITSDFSGLLSLLYRLDISEKKLKQLLNDSPQILAGEIISEMIIERQLQKIAARKRFKQYPDIPEEEKW